MDDPLVWWFPFFFGSDKSIPPKVPFEDVFPIENSGFSNVMLVFWDVIRGENDNGPSWNVTCRYPKPERLFSNHPFWYRCGNFGGDIPFGLRALGFQIYVYQKSWSKYYWDHKGCWVFFPRSCKSFSLGIAETSTALREDGNHDFKVPFFKFLGCRMTRDDFFGMFQKMCLQEIIKSCLNNFWVVFSLRGNPHPILNDKNLTAESKGYFVGESEDQQKMLLNEACTVDGSEIRRLHQLRPGRCPILYNVLAPSQVVVTNFWTINSIITPFFIVVHIVKNLSIWRSEKPN